jgi:hypothetical protein
MSRNFIKVKARLVDSQHPRFDDVMVNMNHVVLFKPATGLLIFSGITTAESMNTYEVEDTDRKRLETAL